MVRFDVEYMKRSDHFVACALLMVCLVSGCVRNRSHTDLADGVASVLVAHLLLGAGMDDDMARSGLVHSIAAFHRTRHRFPETPAELRTFVFESNGLLVIRDTREWVFSLKGDHLVLSLVDQQDSLSYLVSSSGEVFRSGSHSFTDTVRALEATNPVEATVGSDFRE